MSPHNHMLIRDEVEKAVCLQACGYQLLKWLEKALTDASPAKAQAKRCRHLREKRSTHKVSYGVGLTRNTSHAQRPSCASLLSVTLAR